MNSFPRVHLSPRCLLLAPLALLIGCTTPVYDPSGSAFLDEGELLQPQEDLPFEASWRSPKLDWNAYDTVTVRSVSLEHLKRSGESALGSNESAVNEAAEELAVYAQKEFTEVFEEDRENRFAVVSSPTDDTLICEMAITEVVPAKPLVNAAATGLSLLGSAAKEVLVNAGGALAKVTTRGMIAIEAQFKDGKTGEPVFMFADRERGRPSLVNVKDFQRLGHLKAQIRTWARQTLSVMDRDTEDQVRDPFPFEIKFW